MKRVLIALLLLAGFTACSEQFNGSLASVSSSILNSAGIPAGSQESMTSMFDAGSKITKAARGLSDEQEYYLGRGVAAVVFSKYRLLQNDSLNRYVNKVGNAVAAFSDRPETYGGYHFVVLDTTEVNALSAPGGFVFITRGFLRIIPDEDALAAVLAHEVGHIVKGHGTAAISQANLTSALTTIGKGVVESQGGALTQQPTATFGDSITDITDTLLEKGYSRSQEYEADLYGAELLGKAGYNQAAMIVMLHSLESVDPASQSAGWFSTHPSPEKRIDEVKDEVQIVDLGATPAGAQAQKTRTARFKTAVRGAA